MKARTLTIALLGAAVAAAVFVPHAARGAGGARPFVLRRASDSKSSQPVPSIVQTASRTCEPDVPLAGANAPEVLGENFDPANFDEISATRRGRLLAYATTLSEAGLPGTVKQVVLLPEGPGDTSIRIPKAGSGDNDQPSVQFDDFGYRCVFRSVAGNGSDIQLYSLTHAGATDEKATLAVTNVAGGSGRAFDPAFTARVRTREVAGSVKVKERDAFVAFISDADLDPRRGNANGAEQLFLWEEQGKVFRRLTDNLDPQAHLNRPAMDRSGTVIVFESTADLQPGSVDPLDTSRVGNAGGVRNLFLWRSGAHPPVRQLTWSDRDCFSPRMDATGRFVLFSSRGDPLSGANRERRFSQIFAVTGLDGGRPRLRQLTQTLAGDNVLPRPGVRVDEFVFWSTAHPPDAGSKGLPVLLFGRPQEPGAPPPPAQCGPSALLSIHGRVQHVHGYLDVENGARLLANPPKNPVITGPPVFSNDPGRIFFATNDFELNPRTAGEPKDESSSLFALRIALATRSAQ